MEVSCGGQASGEPAQPGLRMRVVWAEAGRSPSWAAPAATTRPPRRLQECVLSASSVSKMVFSSAERARLEGHDDLDPAIEVRGIRSALPTGTALVAGLRMRTRLCSRKRPTMLRTRMFSLRPGTRAAGADPADDVDLRARLASAGRARRSIRGRSSAFIFTRSARFPASRRARPARISLDDARPQVERRDEQLAVVCGWPKPVR